MADLGGIGFYPVIPSTSDTSALSVQQQSIDVGTAAPPTTDCIILGTTVLTRVASVNYAVTGTVSVLGTPTAGYVVRAYRRDNGALLGQTMSVAGGAFSMVIGGYNGEVTVVAYDDTGTAPDYNAVVFDRVIPV